MKGADCLKKSMISAVSPPLLPWKLYINRYRVSLVGYRKWNKQRINMFRPPTFVEQTLFFIMFIKHIPACMLKVGLIWDQADMTRADLTRGRLDLHLFT